MKINHRDYDYFIVFFSGKDALACLLNLIEQGVPLEKIELWHHLVDGREDHEPFMEWPCEPAYARAVANHFGIPIYFSWKEGGFKRELLRQNQLSSPTWFETPDGLKKAGGGRGKVLTRMQFPQVAKIENGRWCSALLKIDVSRIALNNQERFRNARTLTISGERAEESKIRENYLEFEKHECDARDGKLKRWIDRLRPVHKWSTQQVWDIAKSYTINPAPVYRAGFGRFSCMNCIFSIPNQYASVRFIAPYQFSQPAKLEVQFGKTIKPPKKDEPYDEAIARIGMDALADKGQPYQAITPELIVELLDSNWDKHYPIIVDNWQIPAGAFAEAAGPS